MLGAYPAETKDTNFHFAYLGTLSKIEYLIKVIRSKENTHNDFNTVNETGPFSEWIKVENQPVEDYDMCFWTVVLAYTIHYTCHI